MADNYTFSQDYEIIPLQKQRSYPISTSDWSLIKRKISEVKDDANLWQTIGSILIGTAIPALITALSGDFKSEKSSWICWGAFIITLITGAFAFYFGREQRKTQNRSKDDVIDYMNSIEARFQEATLDSPIIIIKSAQYGANGQFADVKEKVSEMIANNNLAIKSSNALTDGVDPMVGKRKRLSIEYTYNGVAKTISIPEHETRAIE